MKYPKPPKTPKPKALTHEELEKFALDAPDPRDDPDAVDDAVEDEYTKKVARQTQAEIDQKAWERNTVKTNDTKHYVTMFPNYGARADGVTDDSGAFNKAIAAASVGDTIYVPRGTYKLSANVTIASGTAVEFESGGILSIDSGKVFTVSGKLIAGNYQIFSGSGTVSLADGAVAEIHPAWWGSTVIQSFTADDATPDVAQGMFFKTANANPTTITAISGGFIGQVIKVIINDVNTTIDFTGTTLKGNGGVDWSPSADDHMTCLFDGTNWYCDISGGSIVSSAISVYLSGDQTLAVSDTWYKLELDTEDYDLLGEYDNVTNYRFTATLAGKYLIQAASRFQVQGIAEYIYMAIRKNGSDIRNVYQRTVVYSTPADLQITLTEDLAVDDYIEVWVREALNANEVITGTHDVTYLMVTKLG